MEMPDMKSPKNYPTGKYLCPCILCGGTFIGQKLSRVCFECHSRVKGEGDEATKKP